MATKLCRVLIIVLVLIMPVACDNNGTGGGGAGEEAGVAEGPSGSFSIGCLTITYEAVEDDVTTNLILAGRLYLFGLMSPSEPRWDFVSPQGGQHGKGLGYLLPGGRRPACPLGHRRHCGQVRWPDLCLRWNHCHLAA